MKKIVFFGVFLMWILAFLRPQIVSAQNYNDEFCRELSRNNIRNIERLLDRRARQMDLEYCMLVTLQLSNVYAKGFNVSNSLDVIKLLVNNGADVNKRPLNFNAPGYGYPLENAVTQDHSFSVVQYLLDSRANPDLSSTGLAPIVFAYSKNNTALGNLFLDRGANGAALLPSLASRGDDEFIRRLISRGVTIRSEQGADALRSAARNGKLNTVKLLVENGVNVNNRNNDGETALSVAYDKGEIEICNYLRSNGAIDFEPKQTANQSVSPAQTSSTTNVYVQPSVPAQSAPAQSATSTPTFQIGRYAWSNSGTNMTMTFNTGVVTAYLNNSAIGIWHGTYRINGNQIVITVSNPTPDYASLRGQTYVYTINSATSFSGSGETWVRTGS
jgi:ankyrin repeat protein